MLYIYYLNYAIQFLANLLLQLSHFIFRWVSQSPLFFCNFKKRTAVGLLLRLFREISAIHRYRTATHSGCSPQLFCLVTMHGACELHLSTHFTVGCAESSHRLQLICALLNRRGAPCVPENTFDMTLHGSTMCSPYDITCANQFNAVRRVVAPYDICNIKHEKG